MNLLSKFTYKGVSLLPLFLFIPLLILSFSDHWAYDESLSYVSIIGLSPWEIITYSPFNLANNHVLNSLYYLLLQKNDVQSLFWFRLPSLIAFFFYYYLIGRLLKQKDDYQLRHIDQLMLFLWPYSIYFAQARGYGIALVGFAAGLYFYKEYLKDAKVKHLLYFVLLNCLASISLFSFIFPFAAMIIIVGLRRFREIITSPVRILVLAISLPVAWYAATMGQIASEFDPGIIGRDTLFKGGTISSLISFMSLMEFAPDHVFIACKWLITLTMLPVLFYMVKRATLHIEITIILVTLALLVFAHYTMGAMYPVYRGVAYMIFLFLLSFVYSNYKRNIFYTIHFSAIILVGIVYLGYIFHFKAQKCSNDYLVEVAADPGVIIVDDGHKTAWADNYMQYRDTLKVVSLQSFDTAGFDNTLDTAKYLVCKPERFALCKRQDEFEPQYRVSTFFYYNTVFYKRKQQ